MGGATWAGRSAGGSTSTCSGWTSATSSTHASPPARLSVDAYLLANTKIDVPWRLFGLDLDGSVFVFGENLGDEEYQHRIGYPMPGRMIQIGVQFGL